MRTKKKDLRRQIHFLEKRIALLYNCVLGGFTYEAKMCMGITREYYTQLIKKLSYSQEFGNVHIEKFKIPYGMRL